MNTKELDFSDEEDESDFERELVTSFKRLKSKRKKRNLLFFLVLLFLFIIFFLHSQKISTTAPRVSALNREAQNEAREQVKNSFYNSVISGFFSFFFCSKNLKKNNSQKRGWRIQ